MAQSRPHYIRIESIHVSSTGRLGMLISAEGNPDDVASVVLGEDDLRKVIETLIAGQPQLLASCLFDHFRGLIRGEMAEAIAVRACEDERQRQRRHDAS